VVAYVLLAQADHDYDGHRTAAMRQTRDALRQLDANLLKSGSPVEKILAAADNHAARAAKRSAESTARLHERQRPSDQQLQQAQMVLSLVNRAMGDNKDTKPQEHVQNAIKEVNQALNYR
jgi:hypothetical protein